MGSHAKTNGETASLKKRKREPKDEVSPLIKRHRSKTKPQQPVNGVPQGIETPSPHAHSAAHRTDGDLKSSNTTPPANTVAIREALAAWKLSKPVGGRMLDIDPIFSHDERSVHDLTHHSAGVMLIATGTSFSPIIPLFKFTPLRTRSLCGEFPCR
jgi:NET1-associated nuclear protein 1 (U3 small nucleolar RNA-associated protein 17)